MMNEEVRQNPEETWKEYSIRRLAEVKALNEALDSSLFGEPKGMENSPYHAPKVYPVKGQHPRIMLNAEMIPAIKATLEDERFAQLSEKFWAKANTRYGDAINSQVRYLDGVFQEESNVNGRFRYNGDTLAILEAKALAYLLTGEEIYAREAIYGIKNTMLTLDYTKAVHIDTYHGASHIMITLSSVFDWCHDMLTEKDKKELLGGIVHLMTPQLEFKFPPANMNAVSGHGTGPQFFRDYTTMALAFYDELPNWWEFVGGRLFQEYIPVLDYSYQEGWVSQGASCYAPLKYYNQAWCEWVVEHACGGSGYFPAKMKEAPYFMISELLPNGRFFPSGDGTVNVNGMSGPTHQPLYFAAAISEDVGIMNFTYNTTEHFSQVDNGSVLTLTPAIAVILASQCPKPTSDNPFAGLNLIRYTGHPGNILTARSGWERDSAVVWMKTNEMTMANHDHQDAGTFQLYYKGLLSCNTGSYRWYGNEHFRYYHQATLGHNGLLVFNPNLYDGAKNEDGTPVDAAKFYYTGGQRAIREAGSLEMWLSGNWETAIEKGRAYGYTADGKAEFGYLAADLTKSYDSRTVDAIERRMLSVFTGQTDMPMLFFTYDSITAGGADYKKTFLLHVINEPSVDQNAGVVCSTNKTGGRLVLQNIVGKDITIEAIGGAGRAYEVNGVNVLDKNSETDNSDAIWGRVEISTVGEKHSEMLNAMYVTDAGNSTVIKAAKVENGQVAGTVLAGTAAIFVRSAEREDEAIRFTTEGGGALRYYISGAAEGSWSVRVNGKDCGKAEAAEEGGILVFTAPAGQVEITADT